jgi:hypothetical protein
LIIAQNIKLDEILENYSRKNGLDRLANIRTLKITGKVTQVGGTELLITNFKKQPNKDRTDWEFQGTKLVSVIDGLTGWMINPISGSFDPQDFSADMIKNGKKNFGMQNSPTDPWNNPFVNWKENGNNIELIGREELNGAQVYDIKIAFNNGDLVYYYMDTENFLILKMKQNSTFNGQVVEVESIFSDFRSVDGFKIPFKLENFYNATSVNLISIDKIEFNIPIEDSVFKKPVVNNK